MEVTVLLETRESLSLFWREKLVMEVITDLSTHESAFSL